MKETKKKPVTVNRALLVISKPNAKADVKNDSNVNTTNTPTDTIDKGISNDVTFAESINYSQFSDSFLGAYDGC